MEKGLLQKGKNGEQMLPSIRNVTLEKDVGFNFQIQGIMKELWGVLIAGTPFVCFAFAIFCWYVKDKSGRIFHKYHLSHQSSGFFISISDIKQQLSMLSDPEIVKELETSLRYRRIGWLLFLIMFIFPILVGLFIW